MNWNSYIKQFSNYLKLERSLSQNSIDAYVRDVEKLNQFMDMTYPSVSPLKTTSKQLQGFIEYINELGMSAHSQARILSGIKAFYKFMMVEDLVENDPTSLLEGPKLGRKLPDTLDYIEITKMLEAIDLSKPEGERNRAMLEVLYGSGLRVSELVELKKGNVYFDIGFLRVIGKGYKERLVPCGKDALKYLKTYIENIRVHIPIQKGFENHVFLNRRGKKLSRVMVFLIIKDLAERIGLKKSISPHT
ncbi:MAG TPA: tyrosine-type recombinase/integrase, partial [Cyclobacteriaceae bacterium]|nr:tyrosine-type recombinase/integrase [Cyclobacteriaceae bacterium]